MKPLTLFLIPLFLASRIFSQAPIAFERYYDFGFTEEGFCVQQTNDGGYIVAGEQRMGIGYSNLLLQKTDSLGNTEWVKFMGSPYENQGLSVKQTFDNGYIVTGYTTNSNYEGMVYLVKTDSSGDTLWTKKLSSPVSFGGQAKDVIQTTDSGYVLIANGTYFSSDTLGIIFLMKTDKNGDTLWTKKINLLNGPFGFSLKQTIDGGFIIAGAVIVATNPTHFALLMVKTDAYGDTLWTKIHVDPITNNLRASSVQQTSDGGYFLVGTKVYTIPYELYMHIEKTDANGDTIWTKDLGIGLEQGFAGGMQTNDGGYIVGGFTGSYGAGASDVFIVKTNNSGVFQWQKTFGGISGDQGNNMQLTSDGGFVITGITTSFGIMNGDIYLVKTDSLGNAPTGVSPILLSETQIDIYPNPFNNYATVHFGTDAKFPCDFILYDFSGKVVRQDQITNSEYDIERNELSSGMYFSLIRDRDGEILYNKKIIIQ